MDATEDAISASLESLWVRPGLAGFRLGISTERDERVGCESPVDRDDGAFDVDVVVVDDDDDDDDDDRLVDCSECLTKRSTSIIQTKQLYKAYKLEDARDCLLICSLAHARTAT
jgi:hypothetical protein